METVDLGRGSRPLLLVGGDLALDFANTVDDPSGPHAFDHLGDAPRVRAWAGALGLPVSRRGASGDVAAVGRLHRLRDAVQVGFAAVADGEAFPDPAWRTLRTFAADAVSQSRLVPTEDRLVPRWRGGGIETVTHAVAYAGYMLLTGPQLARVKHCDQCHWLFLDRSKNGSRRWCSMVDCGAAVKMRRYVAARAARRSGSR